MSLHTTGPARSLQASYEQSSLAHALNSLEPSNELTRREHDALDDLLAFYETTSIPEPAQSLFNIPTADNVVAIAFTTDIELTIDNDTTRYDHRVHSITPTTRYQPSIDNDRDRRRLFDLVSPDNRGEHSLDHALNPQGGDDYANTVNQRLQRARRDDYDDRHVVPASDNPYRAVLAYADQTHARFGNPR
jgi:hypothetical protein